MGCYGPSSFFCPQAAIIRHDRHIFYQFKLGGGSMKTQELILTCRYSDEAQSISKIIQSSFDSFLKKELQNVEKHPYSIV